MRRTRPGGRTAETAMRVAEAVRDILGTEGYRGITFQAVAERAGVSRATVHRRWPTRDDLALHGIAEAVHDAVPIADHGSFRQDLTATLQAIGQLLDSPLGRAAMVTALEVDRPEMHRRLFWQHRSTVVRIIFDRAIERGELSPGVDGEAVFAMASGAMYFGIIVMGGGVDSTWINRIVGFIVAGSFGHSNEGAAGITG